MIGIVDYNAGNIKSVSRSLNFLNIEHKVSKNPSDLESCEKIIFPGVGDAFFAMKQLKETGFDVFLKNCAECQKPLLGICLGSQIIFEFSEEGNTECLGLVKGSIKHFSSLDKDMEKKGFKVPHMGWNSLSEKNGGTVLLDEVPLDKDFYFVHSYVICPNDKTVIHASSDYCVQVPAIIQSGKIYACQFHPEKSGEYGLKILQNFCKKG